MNTLKSNLKDIKSKISAIKKEIKSQKENTDLQKDLDIAKSKQIFFKGLKDKGVFIKNVSICLRNLKDLIYRAFGVELK